jgi:hypothetical protein
MREGNKLLLVTVVTVDDSKSNRGGQKFLAESIGKIVTHCHHRHPGGGRGLEHGLSPYDEEEAEEWLAKHPVRRAAIARASAGLTSPV